MRTAKLLAQRLDSRLNGMTQRENELDDTVYRDFDNVWPTLGLIRFYVLTRALQAAVPAADVARLGRRRF